MANFMEIGVRKDVEVLSASKHDEISVDSLT
jgi:hypothetical protein